MTRHLPCLCETICNVLIDRFYTYCLFASAKIPPGRRQEQSMKAAPSAHLVRALIRGHHVATQAQRHAAGPLQLRQQLHRNQRAQRPGAKTRPAPGQLGRICACRSAPAHQQRQNGLQAPPRTQQGLAIGRGLAAALPSQRPQPGDGGHRAVEHSLSGASRERSARPRPDRR